MVETQLSPVSWNWPPRNVEVNASGLGKYLFGMSAGAAVAAP